MEETEKVMAGLLEILAFRTGCMYLSDLRQPRRLPQIRRVIEKIPPEQFGLWEWNDAVAYIAGSPQSFASAGEAARYLAG